MPPAAPTTSSKALRVQGLQDSSFPLPSPASGSLQATSPATSLHSSSCFSLAWQAATSQQQLRVAAQGVGNDGSNCLARRLHQQVQQLLPAGGWLSVSCGAHRAGGVSPWGCSEVPTHCCLRLNLAAWHAAGTHDGPRCNQRLVQHPAQLHGQCCQPGSTCHRCPDGMGAVGPQGHPGWHSTWASRTPREQHGGTVLAVGKTAPRYPRLSKLLAAASCGGGRAFHMI